MAELNPPLRVVLAPAARRDIRQVLEWSLLTFGESAYVRYKLLLEQALRDIVADPERPGSQARPELAPGARTFHLFYSRERAKTALGMVKTPRHFLVYRRRGAATVHLVRVLHDARDLDRGLPSD